MSEDLFILIHASNIISLLSLFYCRHHQTGCFSAPASIMHPIRKHKSIIELLWWVFTGLVLMIILFPIWESAPAYPFFFSNALMIIMFITFTRYIFLLPVTFIARLKWIKVFIIAVAVLFFFVSATALSDFRNFLDEKGLQTLVSHLTVQEQSSMISYMKNEMIFFGVGSIIAGIVLPFRMIKSLWRMRNKGTV